MKFNCGLTDYEMYKLAQEQSQALNKVEQPWVKVFAWWPVRIGTRDCRWLEYIEKRDSHFDVFLKFWTDGWYAKPQITEYRSVK